MFKQLGYVVGGILLPSPCLYPPISLHISWIATWPEHRDAKSNFLSDLLHQCVADILIYGYGSIPINTIFSGMNIHLPAILGFTRGTRFWHTAICIYNYIYIYVYMIYPFWFTWEFLPPPETRHRKVRALRHPNGPETLLWGETWVTSETANKMGAQKIQLFIYNHLYIKNICVLINIQCIYICIHTIYIYTYVIICIYIVDNSIYIVDNSRNIYYRCFLAVMMFTFLMMV